ncbi:MAG: hypothetical protein JO282_03850 [Alphaproteobacteria bacterium]|nr:hypothetical protein [Alphaproteobacteria bacterium]
MRWRASILALTSIIIIPKVVRVMCCARKIPRNFTAARAYRQWHVGSTFLFVLLAGGTRPMPAVAQGGPETPPAAGGGPAGGGPETPAVTGGAPAGGGPDILPLVPGGGFGFPNPLNPPGAINNAAPPVAAGAPFNPLGLTPLGFGVVPLQANDPNAPAYLIRPYASVSETLTDNAHYVHSPRDAAAYTNLSPGVSFSADTPRLQAVLTGSLNTALYIPSSSNLNQVYGSLYANGFGTIVPDALFVNLNSFVTQSTTLPGFGFQNLSRLPTNQQTQVYSNTVSPFLRKSFDGLVDSELRYTFGSTNYGGNTAVVASPLGTPTTTLASSTFNEGTFIAATGQDISRTLSRLTLDASNYNSGTTNQNSQVGAFNDLEYRITPQIAALARVGYQNIQYPHAPAATFVGPTWLMGGALGSYAIGGYGAGPGYLALQYGRQQGVYGFTGSAQYNITPTMVFTASLVQGVSGQSQYLASTIASSTLDPYGSIVDEYSGLPTAFYTPGLGLSNNVYRQHLLNFGVTETIERDHYTLYGTASNYQSLTPPITAPTKSVGVNFSWGRDIRPDLNGYASLGYYNSSNVVTVTGGNPFGSLNTLTGSLGVNYLFAQNLTGSILYSFSYQPNGFGGTTGRGADVVVNQLTFSLSKAF